MKFDRCFGCMEEIHGYCRYMVTYGKIISGGLA